MSPRKPRTIDGQIILESVHEEQLFFNSHFESGNLRQAFKVPPSAQKFPNEYNLYLQDDTNNDNSLTQWFYFGVRNIKAGTTVRLNILNLMKDDSCYSQGMKPFVWSAKKEEEKGVKWERDGFNIVYSANG